MTKRLFRECDDRYTDQGSELAQEVSAMLTSIARRFKRLGYSMRDVEYIMMQSASQVCLMEILNPMGYTKPDGTPYTVGSDELR